MAKLGQHYLTDSAAVDKIVKLSGAGPADRILEIGPGRGALTKPLVETGAVVTAVEVDEELAGALKLTQNLTVINDDFLRLDLNSLGQGPWIVVGNLPYAVGSAILQKVLLWQHWTSATFMFQREVAKRIVSEIDKADYGLLTLSVALRAEATLAFELEPSAFRPRPQVQSAVVYFRRLPKPRLEPTVEKMFWTLAKTAFMQRRKMAAGVISKALKLNKSVVDSAFNEAGVSLSARPQEISFKAWTLLAQLLLEA